MQYTRPTNITYHLAPHDSLTQVSPFTSQNINTASPNFNTLTAKKQTTLLLHAYTTHNS
jgi:hypothetical protein